MCHQLEQLAGNTEMHAYTDQNTRTHGIELSVSISNKTNLLGIILLYNLQYGLLIQKERRST